MQCINTREGKDQQEEKVGEKEVNSVEKVNSVEMRTMLGLSKNLNTHFKDDALT